MIASKLPWKKRKKAISISKLSFKKALLLASANPCAFFSSGNYIKI